MSCTSVMSLLHGTVTSLDVFLLGSLEHLIGIGDGTPARGDPSSDIKFDLLRLYFWGAFSLQQGHHGQEHHHPRHANLEF